MSKSCLIDFWRWIYCLCDVLEMLELFWWRISFLIPVRWQLVEVQTQWWNDKIKITKTVGCLKIMQPPGWLQMLSFSMNNVNVFFHNSETCVLSAKKWFSKHLPIKNSKVIIEIHKFPGFPIFPGWLFKEPNMNSEWFAPVVQHLGNTAPSISVTTMVSSVRMNPKGSWRQYPYPSDW